MHVCYEPSVCIRVWDVAAGKETKKFGPTTDDLYGIAWSKDTKTIVTAGYAGNLNVWALTAPKASFSSRIKSPTYCVAFAPDGKTILSGHENGMVAITKR